MLQVFSRSRAGRLHSQQRSHATMTLGQKVEWCGVCDDAGCGVCVWCVMCGEWCGVCVERCGVCGVVLCMMLGLWFLMCVV